MARKRLTLLGTSLDATEVTNLAIPMLEAYLLAQPEIVDSWEITRFNVVCEPNHDHFSEQTVADVIASEPDVLGLNCHCWDMQAQLELAAAAKRARPSTGIVLGGHELGIRVRETGIPFVLGTREFPEADLKRAVEVAQRHAVVALCELDGPPEWITSLVLPDFHYGRGMISSRFSGHVR